MTALMKALSVLAHATIGTNTVGRSAPAGVASPSPTDGEPVPLSLDEIEAVSGGFFGSPRRSAEESQPAEGLQLLWSMPH